MKKTIFAMVMFLVACTITNSPNSDSVPGIPIPLAEMNAQIVLRKSPGMVDIYNAIGTIDLYIENLSDSPVSFSPDYGSKILIKREGEWEEVDNDFDYSVSGVILPTKSQYPPGLDLSVKPILTQTERPITLRIVVVGVMVNIGESVGAYLDVILE
ncbi:MAG TPA: hypothetical protein PKC99_18905 [Anaerolineales bacterium]|jgi:hypothetical protein|nr:hypothetical protein [Anaerolineales bacterium]GER79665.1 conserved hypothetical protein [Candidatus Denitrolinea symbiosum]HMN01077.1 hypothetical protein [Anaerolineales bacterium]HPO87650.1 hypothetical protein [Candidatus Hydrogenedentota bacterium]